MDLFDEFGQIAAHMQGAELLESIGNLLFLAAASWEVIGQLLNEVGDKADGLNFVFLLLSVLQEVAGHSQVLLSVRVPPFSFALAHIGLDLEGRHEEAVQELTRRGLAPFDVLDRELVEERGAVSLSSQAYEQEKGNFVHIFSFFNFTLFEF